MSKTLQDYACDGVVPTGAFSPWPREDLSPKVKPSMIRQAGGAVVHVAEWIRKGNITLEIYNERMDTCRACPAYIHEAKRCSECGCFMEKKAWANRNPQRMCPLQKWSR